jgi:hypothetical protein
MHHSQSAILDWSSIPVTRIRVVQFSNTPVAGSPWFTHKALNQWTHVKSRLIQHRYRYGDGREYPHDELFTKASIDTLGEADVIHLHNHAPGDEPSRKAIHGKPVLMQHHQFPPFGSLISFKPNRYIEATIAQPMWADAFAQAGRELPLLPNLVPIRDEEFRPIWEDEPKPHDRMHVAYAPTLRAGKGLHNKGYGVTKNALEKLKAKGLLTFEILQGLPLLEVLARKRQAHVVIDEVVTGNFHRASLESLSQGACVIAHLPKKSRRFLCDYLQIEEAEIPWVVARQKNLYEVLGILASKPDLVVGCRIRARRFMERHWDDQKLVWRYVRTYEELLRG